MGNSLKTEAVAFLGTERVSPLSSEGTFLPGKGNPFEVGG